MRRITFRTSSGITMPLSMIFNDIPELELFLQEFDFEDEANIDEFIKTISKYLMDDRDVIAPMAIITNEVFGVSIRHNGIKYYLIIRKIKGGE